MSKRLVRLQVMLTDEEIAEIEDWRFTNRQPSRSSAVRALIRESLDRAKQEETDQTKS